MLFPVGSFEIIPGISLGAARFSQRNVEPGNKSEHDSELVMAPGVSFQARLAGLLLIPELQYTLGSAPELPWSVQHRGPLASIRLMVPFEVGRFRH